MSAVAVSPQASPTPAPSHKLVAAMVGGGLLAGALVGYLSAAGHFKYVFVLPAILGARALWKRPHLGPAVLLGGALLCDQAAIPNIPITARIPYFQALGPGHLQGADMVVLLVAAAYLFKRRELGWSWKPRTHVATAVVAVMGAVVFGIGIGQMHGGVLREALMEARPYVYLAASYFLTSVMATNRKTLYSMLWAFVVCVGIKAVQGIYVYYKHRHDYPRPESFIGHEASYFFVIYLFLVLALWLFNEKGRLRTVATRLVPVILFCALVNDRRLAWEMLGAGIMTLGVIVYYTAPGRRRLLGNCVVGLILISAVYFPLMWNRSDSLAQPARAIRSQISPTVRDASSDLYRVQENANLQLNIRQGGALGKGFGVKINYRLPITDITSIDPLIAYVPHDGVLYVIVRMGILGALALWSLIATGIVAGCRLARARDSLTATIGAVVACSLVAYALMGAVDQGFFWYRIAFVTGSLLGLGEAARRIHRTQPAPSVARLALPLRRVKVLIKAVRPA